LNCPFSVAKYLATGAVLVVRGRERKKRTNREVKNKNETKEKKAGSLNEHKTWSKEGVKEIMTEIKENYEGTRAMSVKQK
jgi:hypothetical protein